MASSVVAPAVECTMSVTEPEARHSCDGKPHGPGLALPFSTRGEGSEEQGERVPLAGRLGLSSATYPEPQECPFQGGALWLTEWGAYLTPKSLKVNI